MKLVFSVLLALALTIAGLYCVTKLALAQDVKKAPDLTLTKEEIEGLGPIQEDAKSADQDQKDAVVTIRKKTDDTSLLSAARQLQSSFLKRELVESKFAAWLEKAQKAHNCPDCTLSQDGKTLVKKTAEK